MADTPSAFMALDAGVKIASKSGERIIPLSQFYMGKGESPNVLKQDELVTEVIVRKNGYKSSYVRFGLREAIDFPVIGVSASLLVEDGAIRNCRIVFTGISSSPVRASASEEILKGKGFEKAMIEKAAMEASREIKPISQMGIPASYKRRLGGIFVKKAVEKAIKKALEEVGK
jgi:CO/xanthine dehydrogenase FAD-binding subunit